MTEYTNSNIERLIDEYIHSERDRAIMKRRLIDGICFEPLAEEFDLSVSQVQSGGTLHLNSTKMTRS